MIESADQLSMLTEAEMIRMQTEWGFNWLMDNLRILWMGGDNFLACSIDQFDNQVCQHFQVEKLHD